MAIVFENYLVSRNVRGKVQIVHTICEQNTTSFETKRFTSQLAGKITPQPVITITSGKVKRTPIQQAELEYKSILKKYMDKGYTKIEDLTEISFEDLSDSEIDELVNTDKEDQNGVPKPMLAVSSEKCSSNIFEKEWYCSRKLDGVRCCLFLKDNEIHSASRGGGEYNIPTTKIRASEKLIKWFIANPDLKLDGELYNHGTSLQKLSGMARVKEWESKCDVLNYWIYDIYHPTLNFVDRYELLMELQEIMKDEPKITVIDHYLLSGYLKIKKTHDQFVREGYEGLVMRNPNKPYGIGKRSSVLMVKLKERMEEEFEIIGVSEGLRDEDFCFTLKTKTGKSFDAKPMGTREVRAEYLATWEDLVGKKASVTFFSWSDDGIPSQPVFKCVRDYE